MFLMLTLYMQQVLGYSAMKTGVAYLAVAGTAARAFREWSRLIESTSVESPVPSMRWRVTIAALESATAASITRSRGRSARYSAA